MSLLLYFFYPIVIVKSLLIFIIVNPIYAILVLFLIYFDFLVYFIWIGLDFIGILNMIIYCGVILVLFLFIIMIIPLKNVNFDYKYYQFGSVIFLFSVFFFFFFYNLNFNSINFYNILYSTTQPIYYSTLSNIHDVFTVNFFSNTSFSLNLIGYIMYKFYFLLVIFIGVFLLIGIVAVIYMVNDEYNILMVKKQKTQYSRLSNYYLVL